jgi:hypothetical protein
MEMVSVSFQGMKDITSTRGEPILRIEIEGDKRAACRDIVAKRVDVGKVWQNEFVASHLVLIQV